MALRHFLELEDFTSDELEGLITRAIELKRMWNDGERYEPLRNRTLAMIFTLASTRTRVSFDVGMRQFGGGAIILSPADTQLGRGEPVEDMARVLSEMVDAVMIRTTEHEQVQRFANASRVPVINGMTNRSHPCQVLADIQTFVELRGSIRDRTVAFVGDGYNMCQSYLSAASLFGFKLRFACPQGYQPDAQRVQRSGNSAVACTTAEEAVMDADLVVTDVWSSMGQETEQAARRLAFNGYQINDGLMARANRDAVFMHCLPAHRGEEISEHMLDHPQSAVFQESGNRLHTQKALLEFLLVKSR